MKIINLPWFHIMFIFFNSLLMCDKLPKGNYRVHFTEGYEADYRIKIIDSNFVKYLNSGDSILGKIHWLGDWEFRMDPDKKSSADSIHGPLKLMYDSWGEPCIEIKKVNGDTIKFRTTFPHNLHITQNEGYFIKVHAP